MKKNLLETHPYLAKEWDYKNNDKGPEEYTHGCVQKVWWICSNHNESWYASINSRTNMNSGCPYCANQKVLKGFNDLETKYPELVREWDYKKNKKDPTEYVFGSTAKVYWKCSICKNGWDSKIVSRTHGDAKRGCPYCSGQKIKVGFNDLETKCPNFIEEWHYEKNQKTPREYTMKSGKQVWWKCKKCKHEWRTSISSRTAGTGCSKCGKGRKKSFPELLLYFNLKPLFKTVKSGYTPDWLNGKELDIFIEDIQVAIEYDGIRFHKDNLKDKIKDKLIGQRNLIRIKENKNLHNLIYKKENIIYIFYKPKSEYKNLHEIFITLIQILRYKYNLHLSFDFLYEKYRMEILKVLTTIDYEKSMGYKYPLLQEFWDCEENGNLTIFEVSPESHTKFWWTCIKEHSWAQRAVNGKVTCEICSGRKVLQGFNDLEFLNPKLAKEWDYHKNILKPTEVTANSSLKVYWLCPDKNHSYFVSIRNRNKGTRCQKCIEEGIIPKIKDSSKKYVPINKKQVEKKIIVCINTGEIFKTPKLASEYANLKNANHIRACCNGKRKSAGKDPKTGEKLIWAYKEES